MKKILMLCLAVTAYTFSFAQDDVDASESNKANYLKIYLDGSIYYENYIREQITFVNYVRDRFEADVHLLATRQNTGSGGDEFSLFFFGQNRFAGKSDTMKYIANTNNTEDETRTGLTNMIKLGLMRYIAFLPEAQMMSISFAGDTTENTDSNPIDKWRNWVFTISGNGNLNGVRYTTGWSAYGNLSAKKITDKWKISLNAGTSYSKDHYDYQDFTYDSKTESKSANALVVKSAGKHFSVGANASALHSSYSNYEFKGSFSPAAEYDVFPYSTSTSKIFTFLYEVIPSYQRYIDTTIYNKTEEFLMSESLSASLTLIEKWGSVSASLAGSHYFHDFSANQVSFFTGIQWRVASGLSFNLFGDVSLIHDQINLEKAGATDEELLTQQKELATSYSYSMYVGISYTFGSIFNNCVNPRFDGGNNTFYY